MSEVELRHLATMAAIDDEGSFGRAAARLGYTQSTVSQHIAVLERVVGGTVFDRPGGPKPVRLTPLGSVVLSHGRDLLDRSQAMTVAVERFKAGDGRIDIGTFQSVSNVLLPLVIRQLREEHPGCDIRLSEDESDSPPVDKVDLMFHDSRLEGGDIEHLKLLDDPYVLVAPRGAFPAGPVQLSSLHRAPMVAWPPTCDQPRVEQMFAHNDVQPQIVFRAAGNEAVLAMVRSGLGSAVLPRLVLGSAAVDPALSIHELRPAPPQREIYLLWRAGRTQSPLTKRAIEIAAIVAAKSAELGDAEPR
ncbi:LysR family transcriptional regulator [Kribbella qitaiheensis]|uniref:LysR family transcriptional regulator n=1 Tax=Kribbella qitaiheensis TaxID=1544730 RepID=A0A7G6X5G5_9ACTN|nr:LysR family transcriptional regulator [Kribbella qitaiheensis]QNE21480.1 LysR family transcriptional regulator [Kribbella qitaiheensis]